MTRPAGVVVACPCGEVYELKPEYAGRLVSCAVCGRHLRVPRPGVVRPPDVDADPAFDRDVFLLNQRALAISSQYEVWTADGRPVLYVERPTYLVRTVLAYVLAVVAATFTIGLVTPVAQSLGRLSEALGALAGLLVLGVAAATFLVVSMSARPLRHVTVYRDESRREPILRVLQEQRVAFLERTYAVRTAAGEPLARLRKIYVHNLVRKRWYVERPLDGTLGVTRRGPRVGMAIEDSVVLALLRRVLGSFFGLLRTNFLVTAADGEVLGEFNRKFTLLDRYVLDLSADVERRLDRRVALALGVMLDTGERR